MKRLVLVVLLLFCFSVPASARPKVGLVLGGGGAKGAATLGALRIIEKSGIKIDYIAGTSIGAIIGGLYATGLSLDEIESYLFNLKKLDALNINYIESELRRTLKRRGCEYFENTQIPFRCVAVDIDNMKEVVLSEGKLWKAILASMSIPIIYPFVEWDNMALGDGGLLNNLPVDVAKAMGADIVIAIDLQQNEADGLQIPSFGMGGIIETLTEWAALRPDKIKYKRNVKSADIYIHPSLKGFSADSFGRQNCERMKKLGESEVQKHWDELIKLKKQLSSDGS